MEHDTNIPRIFIGHAWDFRREYYRLEKMLDELPGFRWQNIFPGLVNPRNDSPERLERAIRGQIESSEVVLVMTDIYEKSPELIEKEIEIARELGIPIIGIGSRTSGEVPPDIRKAAFDTVGWNGKDISDVIRNITCGTVHGTETTAVVQDTNLNAAA